MRGLCPDLKRLQKSTEQEKVRTILGWRVTNTNAVNEMLKRVQHDKECIVIPNLFRNLEFGNDTKLIAPFGSVLISFCSGKLN